MLELVASSCDALEAFAPVPLLAFAGDDEFDDDTFDDEDDDLDDSQLPDEDAGDDLDADTPPEPKAKKGAKKGTENWKTLKASNMRPQNSPEHKNIIYPKADLRKIGDMPEDIRNYYGLTLTKKNKNKLVDINNGCHFRILEN
jgi:hypothetical protein